MTTAPAVKLTTRQSGTVAIETTGPDPETAIARLRQTAEALKAEGFTPAVHDNRDKPMPARPPRVATVPASR